MPQMNETQDLVLNDSELFDLEQELKRRKEFEGFSRAVYTTLDKCILLLQMYQRLLSRHTSMIDKAEDATIAYDDVVRDMTRIYNLVRSAQAEPNYSRDLMQQVMDYTLKYSTRLEL